jgi:hypothetical protein
MFKLRPLDTAAEDQNGGEEQQGSQADSPATDSSAGLTSSPNTRACGELAMKRSDGDPFIASGLVTLSLRYNTPRFSRLN